MKKIIICPLLTLLAISCKMIKDEDYFFGKIDYINNDYKTVELRGDSISVEGLTFSNFSVYDSLILFWHLNMPQSMTFSISNIKTGNHYGYYVPQGRGPHESPTAFLYQFYKKGDDITTLLISPNEDELREWNISQTLEEQRTVYDTIFPYRWRMDTPTASSGVFRVDKNSIFVKTSKRYSKNGTVILEWPQFQIRSLRENKILHEYEVYKNNIRTINPQRLAIYPFSSSDCLKPDGKKAAIGMKYLDQINILDLENGNISYHRAGDSPNLSIWEEEIQFIKMRLFNYQCQCDDEYIYSLYFGHTGSDEFEKPIPPDKVRQFDWNGRLIHEINLSEPATQIWLDSTNNLLYSYNEFNEHILRYDLNELDN